jgi:hypothetical protein
MNIFDQAKKETGSTGPQVASGSDMNNLFQLLGPSEGPSRKCED